MENKLIKLYIEDAKRWFAVAKLSMDNSLSDKAMYAMEMSLEMVLKAVLLAFGAEFPKTHNVSELLRNEVRNSKVAEETKDKLYTWMDTFDYLLEFRNASGYRAQSSIADADFKDKANKKFGVVKDAVDNCESIIKKLM